MVPSADEKYLGIWLWLRFPCFSILRVLEDCRVLYKDREKKGVLSKEEGRDPYAPQPEACLLSPGWPVE